MGVVVKIHREPGVVESMKNGLIERMRVLFSDVYGAMALSLSASLRTCRNIVLSEWCADKWCEPSCSSQSTCPRA